MQQQYTRTFSDRTHWERFVGYVTNDSVSPDDLDAVYNYFEGQRGMTRDWMEENGQDHNWLNTVDAEIDDLHVVGTNT